MPETHTHSNPAPVALVLLLLLLVLIGGALWLLRGPANILKLPSMILTSGSWSPYSGVNLPQQGVAGAVVAAVLERMGFVAEIQFMPWPKAEDTARTSTHNGSVRATFPYVYTDDRAQQFYYSQPIIHIEQSIYFHGRHRGAAQAVRSAEDLGSFRIVPIVGYSYVSPLSNFLADDIQPVANNQEAFTYLLAHPDKKLVVVEATPVAYEVLRNNFPGGGNEFAVADYRLRLPVYLMASKLNPHNRQFVADFDRALSDLQAEGRIQSLALKVLAMIDADRSVMLVPAKPGDRLLGYADLKKQQQKILPQGTRAVIEQWGEAYFAFSQFSDKVQDSSLLVKVRVINGPASGSTLFVDGRSIVIP
jgi:polar amino acid transport system substrate-binding protein